MSTFAIGGLAGYLGSGGVDPPPPPTTVSISIIDQGDQSFGLHLAWTPPFPIGSTVGYLCEARYFHDAGLTTPDSDWIPLTGLLLDAAMSEVDIPGPYVRPAVTQWVLGRVRSVNARNATSAWAVSSTAAVLDPATGGIGGGAVPPPQPVGWTIKIAEVGFDDSTRNPVARIEISIPTSDPSIIFYTPHTYKGASPPASPAQYISTNTNEPQAPSPPTIVSWWVPRDRTGPYTLQVVLCASSATYISTPTSSHIPHSVVVPQVGAPGPVTSPIVTCLASSPVMAQFRYQFTQPVVGGAADIEFFCTDIYRREVDSAGNPVNGGSGTGAWGGKDNGGIVASIAGDPSTLSPIVYTQQGSWDLSTESWWQFRFDSVSRAGLKTVGPVTSVVHVPAAGGTPDTPPPQLEDGDWTVVVVGFEADASGNQVARIQATVTGTPSGVDQFSAFQQYDPTMSQAAPTPDPVVNSKTVTVAVEDVDPSGTTILTWTVMQRKDPIYLLVEITSSAAGFEVLPDDSTVMKQLSIPGFGTTGSGGGGAGGGGTTTDTSTQMYLRPISEIPEGPLDGSNTDFTLTYTPEFPRILLFLNGVYQNRLWAPADYTIDGNTISYVVPPVADDEHEIHYDILDSGSPGGIKKSRARYFGDSVSSGGGSGTSGGSGGGDSGGTGGTGGSGGGDGTTGGGSTAFATAGLAADYSGTDTVIHVNYSPPLSTPPDVPFVVAVTLWSAGPGSTPLEYLQVTNVAPTSVANIYEWTVVRGYSYSGSTGSAPGGALVAGNTFLHLVS